VNLPGLGILKGMAVTARNLLGSYVSPDQMVTRQYPEEAAELTESYRNFPFLVHDGGEADSGMRCVACKICERECPPQCIYIVSDRDAAGKLLKRPRIFDIDVSVCMSCQICVEVCPFDAIRMDQVFELSDADRFESLLLHKADLLKPDAYFHRMHPTEAAVVEERREAVRQKKAQGAEAGKEPTA